MIDELEVGERAKAGLFYENYVPLTAGLLSLCGVGAISERAKEAARRRYGCIIVPHLTEEGFSKLIVL